MITPLKHHILKAMRSPPENGCGIFDPIAAGIAEYKEMTGYSTWSLHSHHLARPPEDSIREFVKNILAEYKAQGEPQ